MTSSRQPAPISRKALDFVQQLHPQGLNHVQESVLAECWIGATYQEIAETTGYDDSYIRSIGAGLWKDLSRSLGQKVTKSNFRVVLNRHLSGGVQLGGNHSGGFQADGFSSGGAQTGEFHQARGFQAGGAQAGGAQAGGAQASGFQSSGFQTGGFQQPSFPAETFPTVGTSPSRELLSQVESPRGQVPLSSPLYIERPPVETTCYQEVLQPGALIRIKAPKQMGKTSLMVRTLERARQQGYATVPLNLELASTEVLSSAYQFLQWVCVTVGKALQLPNRLEDYWEDVCGSSYNCSDYFESYLLSALNQPLVLAIDNADIIFNHPEIAADFFGVLRAWYESARYGVTGSDVWQRLRLIVVYSTEIYIPLNTHQSPFNVGMPVELPEFSAEQVLTLAERHFLRWSAGDIDALMALVGGNPYLVRLTLYHAQRSGINIAEIGEGAIAHNSIYSDHLQKKVWALEPYPQLIDAIQQVMIPETPTGTFGSINTASIDPVLMLKLEGMGLIRLIRGRPIPACNLYRRYFLELFSQA